ncbi:amidohydrolase family protein [Fodinicola acaciae]|uniref:amidohydrolase family protein n=1 Tax=Fodinicola acaciae TaxID=2681555 RepID=UPI0013D02266|nr:amidohydrolase family protein [Fodinicola acaciae]
MTFVSSRLAALLAEPARRPRRWWLTNATLFDGTGAPPRTGAGVLIEDGVIVRVGRRGDGVPAGAEAVDLAGRTLMPGLVDAHAHVYAEPPALADGAEPGLPGVTAHFVAARLRETLRMGVTTLRDVGSYGDEVMVARQAMRYGAFAGPRLLTCGRIVSATSPGGRFFDGMYREADGPDDVRKAVREQLRRGADFVKVMSTGARSVELEDPVPAQLTRAELAAAVDEAHRLGYRVAAHAEGLAGTELAIELGVDTVEHGMYLGQRPDLLDAMAAAGQVLVPTLSCFYGVAGLDQERSDRWTPPLTELAHRNLDEADRTLKAASAAGVPIALGHDWQPFGDVGLELQRMVHHGLTAPEALTAATGMAARALGIDRQVGTVRPGKYADLLVVDGDPVADPAILRDRARVWLVLRLGEPVAGSALESSCDQP